MTNIEKIAICSDIHGVYLDKEAVDAFIRVVKRGNFDEVVINGDLLDLPLLSRHSQRLIKSGIMKGYTEVKEIEHTKENFLKPLRDATDAKIIYRLGNHDERIYYPYSISQRQLERLIDVWEEYGSRDFDIIMDAGGIGYEIDPNPVRTYYDTFDLIHGLSLAKKAAEKNILERMKSGSSGHTHRLNSTYINNAGRPHCWLESGHLRTGTNVEYFPTAKTPDWQQGFVTVVFSDLSYEETIFFGSTHPIINGRAEFEGNII
jgi:predicted phosphodiesterase